MASKRKSNKPVFSPCSEVQREFLLDDSQVCIFGGGAGGEFYRPLNQ